MNTKGTFYKEEQLAVLRSLKSGQAINIKYTGQDKYIPQRISSIIVTNIMYAVYESKSIDVRQEFQNMGEGFHVEHGKTFTITTGNMVINPEFVAEAIAGYFEISLVE